MKTLDELYDAFLSRVNEDDWAKDGYTQEDLEYFTRDWFSFFKQAQIYFKFPRCSLEVDQQTRYFLDSKMSDDEIQVLAVYMKQQWINRTIDSWDKIKTQYEEHDFSQANLLDKFIKLKDQVSAEANKVESNYYRSVNKRPYHYRRLAGGKNG